MDIALPRRPVARGGEDVSQGKTFGDTPPPPAETPVRGFIIHTINYSTLAKCPFWRSCSLSINILSCGLIDVTTVILTDSTDWRSSSFLSYLSSLWARFRVLRSSSQSVVNGVCMWICICSCSCVTDWKSQSQTEGLREKERELGQDNKAVWFAWFAPQLQDVSLTSGHFAVHIFPVRLPCYNREKSFFLYLSFDFKWIPGFTAMPALWLDHGMIVVGGDFGGLVIIRAARCCSRAR